MCLLLLIWAGLAIYVTVKKPALLEKAKAEVNKHFGGDVQIGGLDISLFRDFPSISLRLSAVSMRDSLWKIHHHDLIQAGEIYISCSLFKSIYTRRVQVGKIFLEHGSIYLYTDSTGYSNSYLLRDQQPPKPGNASDPPEITLSDMKLVQERQDKHKLFDLDVRRLDVSIDKEDKLLRINIKTTLLVKSLAFNTEKGSFVKDKTLAGRFLLQYNTASKILQFQNITVEVEGQPFVFSGRFFPSVSPDPFFLTIETKNARFHALTALMTPNIQQKLDQYDIDKPVSVQVQLDAGSAEDHLPQVQVRMNLDKGSVLTPAGRFTETSFRASFTNEWIRGHKREDENSGIRLIAFTGSLQNLPLSSDTLTITNLKHPQLACDLRSHFPLTQLNDVTGSQTLQFKKGSCSMNLYYKGPVSENDTAGTTVNGYLDLDSAALTYLPYDFQLTGGNGRILFKDQDLVIDHFSVRAGNSKVQVKGAARNLVALLDRNAEDVSMDWSLSTPHLDLEDFAGFVGVSSPATTKPSGKGLLGATFARIDNLLKEGVVRVSFDAADMSYKKFSGAHARASLLFDDHEIKLNKLTVEQGGGSLDLKATLTRQRAGDNSPLTMESHIERVDLPKLFSSFNNFGQQAITGKNLKGKLTADVRMKGSLNGKARMVTNSLKGTVDFSILGGQLIDFEPMQKIHETVLKNKDLSEVRFAELKNQLDLDSTTLTIHRMEIQSTAFILFAEGTYDLKTGADMSLQVPLSNLGKNKNTGGPLVNKGNDSKAGLSLRLRAKTGDDGKLKISWDPFKKALKKGKS